MARDRLFEAPRTALEPFRFDAAVAEVYDDMIARSIPGYGALLGLLEIAARRFARGGTRIYELGCATGTGTELLCRALEARAAPIEPIEIVAVDRSDAMVERCRQRLAEPSRSRGVPVRVMCDDVAAVELEATSFVMLNFTLQFTPRESRLQTLRRIHQALLPGGALVLSEKLGPDEAQAHDPLLSELHDTFRRQNGYSELAISQKRDALENVLVCESAGVHLERLQEAGFSRVYPWFTCLNFASWLALR